MSVKVGLLSALMLPLVAVSAIAETKTTSWRTDGVDDWDWTNDENFTKGAPVADDIVEIPNGFTVYATNAAARARLASLKQVSPQGKTATLVLAVPADETVTIAGPLARDYWCKYGVFVKRGAGLAVLDSESKLTSSSESSDYMLSDILVEGGVLAFKQNATKTHQYNHVEVSEGAVLRTVIGGKQTTISSLTGLGMVTNTSATAQVLSLGTTTFDGVLAKGVKLKAAGRVTLTNVHSTYTETDYLTGNNGEMSTGNGTLCVPSFGLTTDDESATGKSGSFSVRGSGGGVLYLGTGETTDKSFSADQEELRGYPAFIDAGATGGLVLTGNFSPFSYKLVAQQACFVLTGSNTTPCVISGKVVEGTPNSGASSDKIPAPLCFRKQGSGTWRFGHNWGSTFASCLAIDEGTLQFDTLGEAGVVTSLGLATRLIEPSCGGKVVDLPTVDYAYTLGSDGKEGVFEYVGSNVVLCTTRLIALNGTGVICNNTEKPFRFSGVKALTAGAKTLKLTGSGAGENEIAGICDAADRPISVVKEGAGTWVLNGSNTFSGTLSVKAGTLIVRKSAPAYTWFRWNLGDGYLANRICQFWFAEFGLYDKDGFRVNSGMTFNDGDSAPSLAPGEVAYSALWQYGYDTGSLGKLFDGKTDSGTVACWMNEAHTSHNGRGQTLVMRLADGATAPAFYDVAMYAHGSSNNDRAPKAWTLEGSADGIHWDIVHTVTDCGNPMTGKRMWCGAKREYTGDANEPDGRHSDGYALATPKESVFTVLDSVSSVSVSAGATLKAEGESVVLDKLTIDAADAGTVEGFAFAANGIVEIINAPAHGEVQLPIAFENVTGLSNLRNWTCSLNGEQTKRPLCVKDGKLILQEFGLMLIVR